LPSNRLIAVLRYARDSEKGERVKCGISYRRLYHFAEQEQFLQAFFPHYQAYDPVFKTTLQSVPKSFVRKIYDPRTRLKEWIESPSLSGIEADAAAFACLLQKESEVPWASLGITGSLLIGMHTKSSDLDMVAFGSESCEKIYQAMRMLLDSESCSQLRRFDSEGMKELYAQRSTDTQMTYHDFLRAEKRKVNQGSFRERPYFIRFIKEAHEMAHPYGSLHYMPLGRATIRRSRSNLYSLPLSDIRGARPGASGTFRLKGDRIIPRQVLRTSPNGRIHSCIGHFRAYRK
jgi:predicted nucleotidyltransferase